MATSPNQGIMGLQEDYFSKGMLPPEMGLEVADGTMQNLNPQLMPVVDGLTSEVSGQLADISDEELDQVIQLVQQLYDEPDNYAQNRAALIQSGELTEEDLPPEYDPEALATMLYVLRKEKQMRMGGMGNMSPDQGTMPPMAGAAPEMMQPPQGFARGGIAEAARLVAGSGRFGDTMLAHINPQEARLLMKHGGSGTINPKTGLPEFFFKFLRRAWQAVWKPVKKFLNTSVGKIVSQVALNILIPGFGSIIASGLQTAAAGGNFGDIVKSMAISGATSFLSGGLAKQGFPSPIQSQLDAVAGGLHITSEVGKQALSQGLVTTGMGLAQGQNLKDAATSGMTAAATVQAADFGSKMLTPQGKYNPGTQKVEGNRLINEPNAMQQAWGPDAGVGANAPIVDKSAFGKFPATNQSDYAGYLKDPNAANATISTSNAPVADAGVSTAVAPPINAQGSTPFKPVGVGDAFSTIGEGTKQMLTGDFSKGASNIYQGGKDLFLPSSPTTQQVFDSPEYARASAEFGRGKAAYDLAASKLEPGTLRTYGPAAAAGLGVMALSGAFTPPGQEDGPGANGPEFRGPTGADLLKSNPDEYMIQGMPSVRYGSTDPNRRYTMPDVAIPTSYYNAPRYADGGIAGLATGGYPRKTGQISGPGTATSDSIPAMLSDGEFVMTAKAVRGLGKGSRREGAKRMYALMHQLERNAARG